MCYNTHTMYTHKPWQEFYWRQVSKIPRGCWLWLGSKDRDGYGRFGSTNKWSRSYEELGEVRAHRISWVLEFGPVPTNVWVLHKCDTPECVNPHHLFLGTNTENSKDRDTKGRHRGARGERSISPLSEKDVLEIRKMWASGYTTQTTLSKIFGVNQSCISEIVHNKTWKHLL